MEKEKHLWKRKGRYARNLGDSGRYEGRNGKEETFRQSESHFLKVSFLRSLKATGTD